MRLPTPNPDVIYRQVDGGAVLLSVSDEVYFGLNAVGAFIWEHLSPTLRTLDELAAALGGQYPEVPADALRADIRALLDDLTVNGLANANTDGRGTEDATYESPTVGEAHQATAPRVG